MQLVRNVINVQYESNGQASHIVDLQVSTAADLPELDAFVGGGKIKPGSIAQIIKTGQFATLDDDGKWYADGAEISRSESSGLSSAPTRLAMPADERDALEQIDDMQEEPEDAELL